MWNQIGPSGTRGTVLGRNRQRPASVRAGFALALLLGLGGCAGRISPSCPAGLTAVREAQLLFGLSRPGGGTVSAAEWQDFVATEVVPRFPAGFTVIAGEGRWLGHNGVAAREASKILLIVLPGQPDDQQRLDALRAAYRQRFAQESVLEFSEEGCAGF